MQLDALQEIQALISIHKDQTSIVNSLWVLFQGVSLALVGFVFSQEFVRKNARILAFITVAFLVFSFGNQRAIERSQDLIHSGALELREKISPSLPESSLKRLLQNYKAVSSSELVIGHWAISLVVVAAIWVLFVAFRLSTPKKSPSEELQELQIEILRLQIAKLRADQPISAAPPLGCEANR